MPYNGMTGRIYSNDGATLLHSGYMDYYQYSIKEDGIYCEDLSSYFYQHTSKIKGFATSANATEPTYSIGDTFTFTYPTDDGSTFTYYIVEGKSPTLTYDLSQLDLTEGTHSITVVAKADGYSNSEPSNAVEYVVEAKGITNLTGTTWLLKDTIGLTDNFSFTINFEFTTNYGATSTPTSLVLTTNYNNTGKGALIYKEGAVNNIAYDHTGWILNSHIIHITGGTDVDKPELIAWLTEWGELQS